MHVDDSRAAPTKTASTVEDLQLLGLSISYQLGKTKFCLPHYSSLYSSHGGGGRGTSKDWTGIGHERYK